MDNIIDEEQIKIGIKTTLCPDYGVMCHLCGNSNFNGGGCVEINGYAEMLYNAGYRKIK